MHPKTLALLSTVAVSLAACGSKVQTNDGTTGNMAMNAPTADIMNAGGAVNAGPAQTVVGQAFANAAAASDAFEIATSQLAVTKAHSSPIKSFAKQMITGHTQSTGKLKIVAAGLSPMLSPDATLTADQQQKLDALKGQSGAGFDQLYAADQVAAHEQTLNVLRGYAAGGDVAQLKAFATSLAPTVAAHLNMAKSLKP